ncbi:uncharacterized protein [Leptinotarsa decemlineata]|uniref:uncharacterized protein n=1 Tax=Leptinotarsa decemlineata TaxID=7539 RepID=UPI003D30742E
MRISTVSFLLLLIKKHSCNFCEADDLYCTWENSNRTNDCLIRSQSSSHNDCSETRSTVSENLKRNFGLVVLEVHPPLFLTSNIYPVVEWKEAEIRLSKYDVKNFCQTIRVQKTKNNAYALKYDCELKDEMLGEPLFMEINSELDDNLTHKKILFSVPNSENFSNSVSPKRRLIFSYIDFTNSHKLLLKIQPLPKEYAVTHYKVEVFREKENKPLLVDVRIIPAENKPALDCDYITYGQEGHYFFAVSIISKQCPEDTCLKSLTPKLHISRKGMPLAIGIVGASFLIPCVLFVFYIRSYRNRSQGSLTETLQKILIIFKPSLEKHNEVVASLTKTIKALTDTEVILDPVNSGKPRGKTEEKWCSDNLILASHILYINPPLVDESPHDLDYSTFCFLKDEVKNLKSTKKVISIYFPYSWREAPYILGGCLCFELMQDFADFIAVFSTDKSKVDYRTHTDCKELADKIRVATLETERLQKELPEIIITEQTEVSEEPQEADVLL